MTSLYAEIIIPKTIFGNKETLTYAVPETLHDKIQIGQLVEIPLRKAKVRGVVLSTHQIKPLFATKPIVSIIE